MADHNGRVLLDRETEFSIEELFFSTTDLRGVIVHGNDVFVRISGYSETELIGAPHSLVRHPDMPRSVFQLLWETIETGRSIAAYVKNLAKDGTYYWVLALVIPNESGYLSIRLKPTSDLFKAVPSLYSHLLAVENAIAIEPKRRPAAMQAGRAALQEQLKVHGFANYEKFMQHALSSELSRRNQLIAESGPVRTRKVHYPSAEIAELYTHCHLLDEGLQAVFERLEKFKAMNVALAEKSTDIRQSSESIRFLSMNATVTANKLGVKAATLQVVSKSLGAVCDESRQTMTSLTHRMADVVEILEHLIFDLAATKLQSEVLLHFVDEIVATPLHESTGMRRDRQIKPEIARSLTTLANAMATRMQKVFDSLETADQRMLELASETEKLDCNIRTLRFVQFAGEKESASWGDAGSFASVFQQVREHINHTKAECDSLARAINESCEQVRALRVTRTHLRPHLDSLQCFVAREV